jgi:hypothetical protein
MYEHLQRKVDKKRQLERMENEITWKRNRVKILYEATEQVVQAVKLYICADRISAGLLRLLLVLASAVIVRYESRGTYDRILLSQIRDSPNLEGQIPLFISPRNRVAQL